MVTGVPFDQLKVKYLEVSLKNKGCHKTEYRVNQGELILLQFHTV